MNKTSLSALYRRMTLKGQAPLLDADDLAAAADGTLNADRRESVAEALAASPAQAGLTHLLRDLKADSQALAADVVRTQRAATHRRNSHGDRRIAAGRRFGGTARWAGALAACLVAVVGVWTQRHQQASPSASAGTRVVARADVIFSTRDTIFDSAMERSKNKARPDNDHLFRGSFSDG